MPAVEVEKPRNNLHPLTKIAIKLGVAAVIVGVLWGLWQWRVDADKTAFQDAINNQKFAYLKHDYAASVAGWEKYRHGPLPRFYEYEAAVSEGTQLETMRRSKDALEMYKIAEAHRKGNGTAEYTGIARCSEDLGDYATAISYYEKAEKLYASYNAGTSEQDWIHGHVVLLKQKEAANAGK